MAKVLNPLLSSDGKGSVGGLTFSSWRGIRTLKGKATPVRRLRTVQPENRNRIGYLSRSWSGLTNANRSNWRAWAASHPAPDGFGGTFLMSGINAFTKLSAVRMRIGYPAAFNADPPVADLAVGMGAVSAATGGASGQIAVSWALLGTGIVTDKCEILLAGPFQSPGKVEVESQFHSFSIETGTTVAHTCGGLVPLGWYWAKVRYLGIDGQTTAGMIAQAQAKV